MTIDVDEDAGVIDCEVDGEITRAEYDRAVAAMDALIAEHGKIGVVATVRSFAGMELAAWSKDIRWGVGHIAKIRRVAVVTDVGWIAAATKVTGWMAPAEYRVFPLAEREAARAWVRET